MEKNLCTTCIWDFATCKGTPVFGCDAEGGKPTDDNVVECTAHLEKARGWKCHFCGYDGDGNQQYNQFCTKCHLHR